MCGAGKLGRFALWLRGRGAWLILEVASNLLLWGRIALLRSDELIPKVRPVPKSHSCALYWRRVLRWCGCVGCADSSSEV